MSNPILYKELNKTAFFEINIYIKVRVVQKNFFSQIIRRLRLKVDLCAQ